MNPDLHFADTEYGQHVFDEHYTFHRYSKKVRKQAKKSVKWPVLLFLSTLLIAGLINKYQKNQKPSVEHRITKR